MGTKAKRRDDASASQRSSSPAPVMLLPVAPVLLHLSLSTPPPAPSVALSRAGHCVALAKRGSKRPGGGGGFGAKRPQRPGGGGGFGALPPTLEEVMAGFKTRLPEDASVDCPCGNTDPTGAPMSYEACCQPCHAGLTSGEGYAMESPEHCLRCRFSAFTYRLPLPIIATTHPDNRDYRTDRVAWVRRVGGRGRGKGKGRGRPDPKPAPKPTAPKPTATTARTASPGCAE